MNTIKSHVNNYFNDITVVRIEDGEEMNIDIIKDIYIQEVKIEIFDNDIKISNDRDIKDIINDLFSSDRMYTSKEFYNMNKKGC